MYLIKNLIKHLSLIVLLSCAKNFANDLYISLRPFLHEQEYYLSLLVVNEKNIPINLKIDNEAIKAAETITGDKFKLSQNIIFQLFYIKIGPNYSAENSLTYDINNTKYIILFPKHGHTPEIIFLSDNENITKWETAEMKKLCTETHLLVFTGNAIKMDSIFTEAINQTNTKQDEEFSSFAATGYYKRYMEKKDCKEFATQLATKPAIYNINEDYIYENYRAIHNKSDAAAILQQQAFIFFRIFCLHDFTIDQPLRKSRALLPDSFSYLFALGKITLLTIDTITNPYLILSPQFYISLITLIKENSAKIKHSKLVIIMESPLYDLLYLFQKELHVDKYSADPSAEQIAEYAQDHKIFQIDIVLEHFFVLLTKLNQEFNFKNIVILNANKEKTQQFSMEINYHQIKTAVQIWHTSGAFPIKPHTANSGITAINFERAEKISEIIKSNYKPKITCDRTSNSENTKFSLVQFTKGKLEMKEFDEKYDEITILSNLKSSCIVQ